LSVARSASQSALMAGVVAAAGLAALPPADSPPDATGGDHWTGSAMAVPAIGIEGTSDLVPVSDTSRLSLAHETRVALDEGAGSTSILGKEAPSAPDADPLALHGTVLPAALEQGTDLAAGAPAVHALVAPGIAMPSAAMLLGIGGTVPGIDGPTDGAQHNSLVSQVLLDAVAGGTGGGPIDALLDTLPGAGGTGIDHSAPLAAGFAAGPGPGAFGADVPFHAAFALDTLALHHDAPPAAA
jgi:hypothetical protein